MSTRKVTVITLAAVLGGIASTSAAAADEPMHDAKQMQQMEEMEKMHPTPIDQQAGKAHTKYEQEAIAMRFNQEADSLEKEAAEHERLANLYRSGQGVGPKGNAASLANHCDSFVKSLRASAKEAREMARMHHEAAEKLAK